MSNSTGLHQLNRPFIPTDAQARKALARDLSQDCAAKFVRLQRLPLFEVALNGLPAVHALWAAAQRKEAA